MKESKYNKFIRVAEARTNKIIDMIRLLGNCSNTAVYEYTEEDLKKIFDAIESELKTCKNKYQDNSNMESKFSLRR
jgi:hypothetical protein